MTIVGTVRPVPVLALSGADLAAGPAADGSWPTLMALDGASVKWGRQKVLEQPKPATATVRIFDPSGVWAADRELVGQPVELRWTWGATARVCFTGRVAAVELERARVRAPDGNTVRGTLVTFSCTSLLTDLGNRKIAEQWPTETLSARRAHVAAAAAGPVSAVVTPAGWADAEVFASPPGKDTALAVLGRLFDTCGGARFAYDPHTRAVATVARRIFTDPAGLAGLTRDDSRVGVFIAAPGGWIDAAAVTGKDTASKDMDSRLTRAQVTWSNAGTAETVTRTIPGADETVIGERAVSVDTGLTSPVWAGTAADNLADLAAGEASGWTLEPMRWDTARTGGGFETLEQALALLSGTELPGVHFLARTALPDLGIRPVFGVMGGTITYRERAWSVEWQPAPIKAAPLAHAVEWDDLDPALVWDEDTPNGLHESVTYEDLGFVAAGTITDRSS